MARINLLPWREERRRERKQQFLLNAGIAAACAVAAIGLVHVVYQNIIDYQTARNGYLESEIKKLDKTIAEIRDLEKEKQRLIDRMRAIETLQTSRPIIVHIFDELVNTLPEGISLTEITQSSNAITIKGIAESNARVSNFMRNVEASKWVKKPQLNIIETKDEKGRRINNFTLIIEQISAQPESGETGADAKGAKS
ncbi:MAG: PilN domain-containing protein [Gammaproteobacteria bacterium]